MAMVNDTYTLEVYLLYWTDIQHQFFYIPAVSTWALATPEELEEALTSWKKKIDDGTADQMIKEVNSVRRKLGQTTTLVAFKGLL